MLLLINCIVAVQLFLCMYLFPSLSLFISFLSLPFLSPSSLSLPVSSGKWTTYRAMARDTVDKAVEVGALNDPRGCQTDGFILEGGEAWQPTSFIRLVQDYGIEVEVCKCV